MASTQQKFEEEKLLNRNNTKLNKKMTSNMKHYNNHEQIYNGNNIPNQNNIINNSNIPGGKKKIIKNNNVQSNNKYNGGVSYRKSVLKNKPQGELNSKIKFGSIGSTDLDDKMNKSCSSPIIEQPDVNGLSEKIRKGELLNNNLKFQNESSNPNPKTFTINTPQENKLQQPTPVKGHPSINAINESIKRTHSAPPNILQQHKQNNGHINQKSEHSNLISHQQHPHQQHIYTHPHPQSHQSHQSHQIYTIQPQPQTQLQPPNQSQVQTQAQTQTQSQSSQSQSQQATHQSHPSPRQPSQNSNSFVSEKSNSGNSSNNNASSNGANNNNNSGINMNINNNNRNSNQYPNQMYPNYPNYQISPHHFQNQNQPIANPYTHYQPQPHMANQQYQIQPAMQPSPQHKHINQRNSNQYMSAPRPGRPASTQFTPQNIYSQAPRVYPPPPPAAIYYPQQRPPYFIQAAQTMPLIGVSNMGHFIITNPSIARPPKKTIKITDPKTNEEKNFIPHEKSHIPKDNKAYKQPFTKIQTERKSSALPIVNPNDNKKFLEEKLKTNNDITNKKENQYQKSNVINNSSEGEKKTVINNNEKEIIANKEIDTTTKTLKTTEIGEKEENQLLEEKLMKEKNEATMEMEKEQEQENVEEINEQQEENEIEEEEEEEVEEQKVIEQQEQEQQEEEIELEQEVEEEQEEQEEEQEELKEEEEMVEAVEEKENKEEEEEEEELVDEQEEELEQQQEVEQKQDIEEDEEEEEGDEEELEVEQEIEQEEVEEEEEEEVEQEIEQEEQDEEEHDEEEEEIEQQQQQQEEEEEEEIEQQKEIDSNEIIIENIDERKMKKDQEQEQKQKEIVKDNEMPVSEINEKEQSSKPISTQKPEEEKTVKAKSQQAKKKQDKKSDSVSSVSNVNQKASNKQNESKPIVKNSKFVKEPEDTLLKVGVMGNIISNQLNRMQMMPTPTTPVQERVSIPYPKPANEYIISEDLSKVEYPENVKVPERIKEYITYTKEFLLLFKEKCKYEPESLNYDPFTKDSEKKRNSMHMHQNNMLRQNSNQNMQNMQNMQRMMTMQKQNENMQQQMKRMSRYGNTSMGQMPMGPIGQMPMGPIGQMPMGPIGQMPMGPIGQMPMGPIGQMPMGQMSMGQQLGGRSGSSGSNRSGGRNMNNQGNRNVRRVPKSQQGGPTIPLSEVAPLEKTDKAWVPQLGPKKIEEIEDEKEKTNIIFRKVKGILNKLTFERFDSLSRQIIEIGINTPEILQGIICLIFDKALDEPNFGSMYAELCERISKELPKIQTWIEIDKAKSNNFFRKYLLNKCQEEFEKEVKWTEENKDKKPVTEMSVEEKVVWASKETERIKVKRRSLGNTRFIGELFKLGMLTERIMHACVKKLLDNIENPEEEDIESLCNLMNTIGEKLDCEKAEELMKIYFDRIQILSKNKNISSRIRFMLQDVIELRRNKWKSRNVQAGPKTIAQIHQDAEKDKRAIENLRNTGRSGSGSGAHGMGKDSRGSRQGQDGWSSVQKSQSRNTGDLSNFGIITNVNSNSTDVNLGPPKRGFGGFSAWSTNKSNSNDMKKSNSGGFMTGGFGMRNNSNSSGYNTSPALPTKNMYSALEDNPDRRKSFDSGRSNSGGVDKSSQKVSNTNKSKMTEEQAKNKIKNVLKEYLTNNDQKECIYSFNEVKDSGYSNLIMDLFIDIACEMIKDYKKITEINTILYKEKIITTENIIENTKKWAAIIGDTLCDVPKFNDVLGLFLAKLIEIKAITFKDVYEITKVIENDGSGNAIKLLMGIASEYKIEYSQNKLIEMWKSSSMKIEQFLEGKENDIELLIKNIIGSSLECLWPFSSIYKFIKENIDDKSPEKIIKYIESSIDENTQKSATFISILINSILQYVTSKTIFENRFRPKDQTRESYKEEEELIIKLKPLLVHFIKSINELDVIYSIQDFFLYTKIRIDNEKKIQLFQDFVRLFYNSEIIGKASLEKYTNDRSRNSENKKTIEKSQSFSKFMEWIENSLKE